MCNQIHVSCETERSLQLDIKNGMDEFIYFLLAKLMMRCNDGIALIINKLIQKWIQSSLKIQVKKYQNFKER